MCAWRRTGRLEAAAAAGAGHELDLFRIFTVKKGRDRRQQKGSVCIQWRGKKWTHICVFVSREEELNDRGRMRTRKWAAAAAAATANALCIMVVKKRGKERVWRVHKDRSFFFFPPFSPLLLNTPGTFLHSFAQQQQQQLFLCAAFLKAVGHKFTRPEFPRHLFSWNTQSATKRG